MARPRSSPRAIGVGAAVFLLVVVLTGCLTGKRPSISDDPTAPGASTGDPAIDDVLERLDEAASSPFAAEYSVLNKYGAVRSRARVAQESGVEREIVIGTVHYELAAKTQSTCDTATDRCVDRLDDSFVSNLQLTHDFYAESAARKLRRDALSRAGTSQPFTQTFAGQPATCVTVTVTGGQKRYCALQAGPLALLDGPDVHIELTSFSPDPDGATSPATTLAPDAPEASNAPQVSTPGGGATTPLSDSVPSDAAPSVTAANAAAPTPTSAGA